MASLPFDEGLGSGLRIFARRAAIAVAILGTLQLSGLLIFRFMPYSAYVIAVANTLLIAYILIVRPAQVRRRRERQKQAELATLAPAMRLLTDVITSRLAGASGPTAIDRWHVFGADRRDVQVKALRSRSAFQRGMDAAAAHELKQLEDALNQLVRQRSMPGSQTITIDLSDSANKLRTGTAQTGAWRSDGHPLREPGD